MARGAKPHTRGNKPISFSPRVVIEDEEIKAKLVKMADQQDTSIKEVVRGLLKLKKG